MTTALFLLRCTEIGLSMNDLDDLTFGMVIDMFIEKANDRIDTELKTRNATAADIENF